MKKAGIPIARSLLVSSQQELRGAKIKFPAVAKTISAIHKTDVGGVVKDVHNEEELLAAYAKLSKLSRSVIIQDQLDGVELIVGAKVDKEFGHVILVGIGGIYTEYIGDIVFRLAPVTQEEAKEMLESMKGYKLLKGVRGMKPANIAKIYSFIAKFSNWFTKSEYLEVDLNPVFCNPSGCFIADARIVK